VKSQLSLETFFSLSLKISVLFLFVFWLPAGTLHLGSLTCVFVVPHPSKPESLSVQDAWAQVHDLAGTLAGMSQLHGTKESKADEGTEVPS
jgi:hypothetical protein